MQRFQSPHHRQRQQRRQWQQLIYSRWAAAILLLLIVALGHASWKMYQRERESYSRRQEAERQFAELSDRNERTQAAVQWAQTPDGQEYLLRTKYAVGKPGEELYVIVDPPEPEIVPVPEAPRSWWQRFLDIFR